MCVIYLTLRLNCAKINQILVTNESVLFFNSRQYAVFVLDANIQPQAIELGHLLKLKCGFMLVL